MGQTLDQCLMNCDYVTKSREPVIHVFGRSPLNVYNRIHTAIYGFEPFFYVGDDAELHSESVKRVEVDPGFRYSLDGIPVKKVVTFVPGDVPTVKSEDLPNARTYQSKVLFPLNYMCCTGIKSGLSFDMSDARAPSKKVEYSPDYVIYDYDTIRPNNQVYVPPMTMVLDIETNNSEENPNLGNPTQEITMSTFKDSYSRCQYTFAWHPNAPERVVKDLVYHYTYSNVDVDWKIIQFNDEREMLETILEFLVKKNPDIYTGWNVNFDIVYLAGRMKAIGVDAGRLSPLGDVKIVPMKDEETGDIKGYRPLVKGVTVLDMLGCYKGITRFEGMKPSYSLDDVGNDELKLKKLHFAGRVGKLWRDYFKKCVYYNARDVEICHEIDDKLNVIDYHDIIRRQSGCQFADTVYTSRIIETEVLRKAMSIGKVVPTVVEGKRKGKFKGAIVLPPTIGKHRNVLMIDLKSLYPSIIMTLNISPETRVKDISKYAEAQLKQFIKSAKGVYYRKDITGFAKDCLMAMNQQRDMFKACVLAIGNVIDQVDAVFANGLDNALDGIISIISTNKFDLSQEVIDFVTTRMNAINFSGKTEDQIKRILKSEETKYDLMQKAEKAKINTWYGIMGKEGSSLSDVDDAESVTLSAREVILHSADVASSKEMSAALKENFGIDVQLRVLYGDTDSAFIAGLESVTDFTLMTKIAEFVGKFITKSYDKFCKEHYNADVHYLKIRCEEIARVFCMSPKKGDPEKGGKKRYWYWQWGEFKGDKGWIENTEREIEIVGFEAKRSNVAEIGRKVQKRVMELITFDKPPSFIKAYLDVVHERLVTGKYNMDEITFNTTLYDFNTYDAVKKNKPKSAWPEHVRAAYWGIHKLKQSWKPGDKVKVIYVKDSPKKMEKMDVITMEGGKMPKGFTPDYEEIYKKQVVDRLTSVVATEGWTIASIMNGITATSL